MGLKEGKYNIAHSISDATASAKHGIDAFTEVGPIEGLTNMITLIEHTSTWIVREDSPYQSINDLVGKKVCPGPRGSSNDVATQRLLEAVGLSYDDFRVEFLNFADAEQQMLDGHLDALLFSFTTYPHPSLLSVILNEQVRFLPVPEEAIEAVLSKYQDGLRASCLPEGTYTMADGTESPEVKGIGGDLHLVVMEDMSEELVYQLVKTFAENFEKYQESNATLKKMKVEDMAKEITGIPFHPGALKYYKEAGFID
jgi:TRAP transporter TAXI family solute receptor